MTRINLVPVEELYDQHLFAEYRELTRVPKSLSKSLKNHTLQHVLSKIPEKFKLGSGHVMFFYDKGSYLRNRYEELKTELTKRGFKYNTESTFDPDGLMTKPAFNHDYVPDEQALSVIRARIQEKIDMKPTWYRKTIYFLNL